MKFRIQVLFSALILCLQASAQEISFYAEDLHFNLTEENFEVHGLYYFRNLTDQEIKKVLFYPFPDVQKYGDISYIKVHSENDSTSMLATQSDKGSLLKLQIPPSGEVAYRIAYGQKVKNGNAKYIITTTRHWGKPFEFAKYKLTFPDNFKLDSVSILPDSVSTGNGKIYYHWKRKNFMPVTDFEFEFKTK